MKSVARLLASGEPVCFTPQNISESWNVATRPLANNGLGFSVSLVLAEVEKIERILTLLPTLPRPRPVRPRGTEKRHKEIPDIFQSHNSPILIR
jgi:hypothetical protein